MNHMAVPYPTGRPGLLRIPAPRAAQIAVHFAPISARDMFNPAAWQALPLARCANFPGWWEADLDTLNLPDGTYEYEYVVDGVVAPDPFAEELTRFGGYRAVLRFENGAAVRQPFRWTDELPAGVTLPDNNRIVIYEMPLRWMVSGPAELDRQVGLATFDLVLFKRLAQLADLGVNAIELLPVQDSPDTLNWGYGTRFFFAPDWDMGGPIDLKFFIKSCHRRGIRVLLDVVMNHASTECPLVTLVKDEYFIDQQEGRNGWGGKLFRYDDRPDAREFHCEAAEYWIREYHIDGFRIDEFKSIKNWDFIRAFRERAWAAHQRFFPGRPFTVIAEDSDRRFEAARTGVVDALWNFAFRDDARRLLTNQITTNWGQPSRSGRVRMLIGGGAMWEEYGGGSVREGYADMAQSVNYLVSHDVKDAPRMMNEIFGALLWLRRLLPVDPTAENDEDRTIKGIRRLIRDIAGQSAAVQAAHAEALDRCRSAFALLLTSVGIPMFLAGEEFGDVHDLLYTEDTKMSDPVDWTRLAIPGHGDLWDDVRALVKLRTSHAALQRNEVDFFYFHPEMDWNEGVRAFAYCRTAGNPLGSPGQVCVFANCGAQNFPSFVFPWPWAAQMGVEVAQPRTGSPPRIDGPGGGIDISLAPFQVRVVAV
ncbi:MAG: alpha-amylase family glycosyl hydrolase [Bryobacteraceae bacterium]